MGRYDFLLHAAPSERPADPVVETTTPPLAPATPAPGAPESPGAPVGSPLPADGSSPPPPAHPPSRTMLPRVKPRATSSRAGHTPAAPSGLPRPLSAHLPGQAADQAGDAGPPRAAPGATHNHAAPLGTYVTVPFDAAARADQKYTLAFSQEELESLEDVKLELRRRFDVKTTKVALVRCGLWDLVEDYRQQGERSRLVKRLRAQRPAEEPNTPDDADRP